MTQRTRAGRLAVWGTALATLLGASAIAAAPARAADGSVNVITHNLEKRPAALTEVINRARAMPGPELVLLQEVCQGMHDRIRAELGSMAWRQRRVLPGDAERCGGQPLGEVAVWTGAAAVTRANHSFLQHQGHNFGMACVNFTLQGRATHGCSTHLAAGKESVDDDARLTIARSIRGVTDGWAGHLVVVGGDFNSRPGQAPVSQFYDGGFREITQMARGTTARVGGATIGNFDTGGKIDYIFASAAQTRSQGGTVGRSTSPSDHHLLFGTVPLR